jgi:hypothetical protein
MPGFLSKIARELILKKFLILIALVSFLVFLATAKAGLIGEDPINLQIIEKPGSNFTIDEYK